jgi:Zn-dependent protease
MFIETLLAEPFAFLRVIIIVVISITMHELAHGLMAISQGDNTPKTAGHMTLNPVVHMGWESIIFLLLCGISWGQMPVNPRNFWHPKISNLLVAAAGPWSNLALAIACIAGLYFSPTAGNSWISIQFLYLAAQINISLFLFNLLPVPTLDGFHIYSEIFPGLKALESTYFGLFAMAIILISGIGTALFAIGNLIICAIVPNLSACASGF